MYTETQLAKLIEDVEKEFTAHLAKAEEESKTLEAKPEEVVEQVVQVAEEAPLAKAEEKEEKPDHKPEEEKKDDKKEEHEPEAKQEEKKPEAEKPAEEKDHDYDDEDMEHLHKLYGSMSKGELKLHHDACRAALDKCGDLAMAKSEEIKVVEVKIEETKPNASEELLKSELSATSAKYEELKKNFDAVADFLTKLVAQRPAPAAKAITSLDTIAKSEGNEEKTLTKSEIDSVLLKKSQDASLKKSDRDAINAYYLEGKGIESINHLLK